MSYEGLFEKQLELSFDTLISAEPPLISVIIKRDGRKESFDKSKIASAIRHAVEAVGESDADQAESLASAVAIYLSRQQAEHPPTVEQVNDAVERVLVRLGLGRAALAYARYRDRRMRAHAFREGRLQELLHTPMEQEDAPKTPSTHPSLFIRTGEETLAQWDAERIVEALTRETGMQPDLAREIAHEVEVQIERVDVRDLTTSLVRELVDARLVARGLSEYRRRHTRLGVPLYDAERLICSPNQHEPTTFLNPAMTDIELAHRVKKEYALTCVFGHEEVDAHLSGDIHIHGLSSPDRLNSCSPSLAFVMKYGVPGPSGRMGRPPAGPDDFLYQCGSFSAGLSAHFTGSIEWRGLSEIADHLLPQFTQDDARRYLHLLCIGLVHHKSASCKDTTACRLVVGAQEERETCTDLFSSEAPSISKKDQSCNILYRLLGDIMQEMEHPPVPVITLDRVKINDTGEDSALLFTTSCASMGMPIEVKFERENMEPAVDHPGKINGGFVSLNLARAAMRVGNADMLYPELTRLVETASRVHQAHLDFIHNLVTLESFGPLAYLTGHIHGKPFLAPDEIEWHIALSGLNECVQAVTGAQIHESTEAHTVAEQIVAHIAHSCVECSERLGIRILLQGISSEKAARRFASLDIRAFPDAAQNLIKTNTVTHELSYTPGIGLSMDARVSPFEQVCLESGFHPFISDNAAAYIIQPELDVSPDILVGFLQRIYYNTSCKQIVLLPGNHI